MAELVLNAVTGRELGSRPSRRLRAEGMVPGVVYGLDIDPVSLAVPFSELRSVLTTDAGLNALIELHVGGESQLSIVKDLQRHPVRNDVIHVDFIRIDPTAELEVEVRVVLEGEAKLVTDNDGMVDQALFSLTVLASPQSIPNELVVDISELEINDAIRVSDVPLPAGVRTEMDPDEAVAIGTVTRSTLEAMAEDEAAEAEEELGEGAAEADGDEADESGDSE